MQKSNETVMNIVVVMIIIILLRLNGGPDSSRKSSSLIKHLPDLQVVDSTTVVKNYTRYITGTVKNNTAKEYSYVEIKIILYDESGAQVGSTFDNIIIG
jgi:hypothetical protein